MDPLSFTASLAAVVTLGASVATGLYTLAGRMGVAGRDVQQYSTEIKGLMTCLTHVGTIIERLPKQALAHADLLPVITDLLELCERVLDPLGKLQNALNRYLSRLQARKSWKKIQSTIAKVGWIFKIKEEVLFYRSTVSFQHQILATHLAILQTLATQAPSANHLHECKEGNVELALDDLKNTVQLPASSLELTNGQFSLPHRPDRLRIEDNSQERTDESLQSNYSTEAESNSQGQDATQCYPQNLEAAQSNALVLLRTISQECRDDADGLTEDEVASLDRQIQNIVDPEGQFNVIKIELAEELRSLARKTVRKTEKLVDTSWKQPVEPHKTSEPDSRASSGTPVTEPTSQAPGVRVVQPSDTEIWTDAFKMLAVYTSCENKNWSPDADGSAARFVFDTTKWPKSKVPTYGDLVNRLRGTERYYEVLDGEDFEMEFEEDVESPSFCVALESGLIVSPEMWNHIILQPVTTEVYVIGREYLQQWLMHESPEHHGNHIRDFILTGCKT